MITMQWTALSPNARVPEQSHPGHDAGWDLYAADDVYLMSWEKPMRIPTGIALQLPAGYCAWVMGRSGLTSQGYLVHLGLIDPSYRGEIQVMMTIAHETWEASHGPQILRGQRIAQLVIQPIVPVQWERVAALTPTERGTAGFGSTGA